MLESKHALFSRDRSCNELPLNHSHGAQQLFSIREYLVDPYMQWEFYRRRDIQAHRYAAAPDTETTFTVNCERCIG